MRTSPITLRWEFKWFFRRGPPACKNAVYTWLQCTRIFIQTSCRTSNQPTGRRWGSNLPLQTLISAGESSSAPWRYCSPLWLFCCNLLSNSVMWWVVLLFFFIFFFYFCPFFPGAAHWLWKRCICGVCGPADPCDPVLQTGLHNPAVKGDNNPTVLFLKKEINHWVGLWIFVHSDLIQEVSFIRWMKTWRSRRRETLSRKACFTSARTSLKVLKKNSLSLDLRLLSRPQTEAADIFILQAATRCSMAPRLLKTAWSLMVPMRSTHWWALTQSSMERWVILLHMTCELCW